MSLQRYLSQEVPEDTKVLGQRLFRQENVYLQMGDRFQELFPGDEIFASMYDSEGRGAEPPMLMALVTVLQMMEKAPDRLAAEWVVSRIDWKYALHLPLDYAGFHFTDLSAFRARLLKHEKERVLFDGFVKQLQKLGLIKSRGKVRTDSTHVLAVVEKLGRMELVSESVRVAVEAIQKANSIWAKVHLPEAFLESYRARQSEYGLSDSELQEKLIRAGQDGFWLITKLDQAKSEVFEGLEAIKVLRQVLTQQFSKGPNIPPSEQRPAGKEIIDSPHEPEARYGKKRDKEWNGHKAQVTETCDEQLPHMIIDLEPSGGADHDSPELPSIQKRLADRGIKPAEQYVDQGYVSGEHIYSSQKAGTTLMGKPLADTHSGLFRQNAFEIDETAQKAMCPNGKMNSGWSETSKSDWPANKVVIRFSGTDCQDCPFFNHCTTNPKGRSLELHPYRAVLAQRRKEAQQPGFQEKLQLRAGIEATISELVRGYGLRYCRYRGKMKLRLQNCFTAIAANLRRLARWWALQTAN